MDVSKINKSLLSKEISNPKFKLSKCLTDVLGETSQVVNMWKETLIVFLLTYPM